ncbi:LysR family transcriptional regulator [Pseudoclavibacter chungangensis]|uniref:LysR family transcriptional regulator n=1 Tax=Pseudoclavibacter chungangensis TaxID=587635 RepID=A0A7J5BZS8_9MICO|nr:LysR family transcriptional regulator [Pseudoclavibacter chungangensis]KAB1660157.1 LysR family transcriptional regulator [Pseudoclavibacter chungangensis]
MDLQQMRYAVAVDEERNFTRAAARCHVVQSALSHRIKALEREIGVELFARTSRRVEPTAAGEAFLAAARTSLEAAERAVADAGAVHGRVGGTLTVGLIPTVTAIDVPAALGAFHRLHPEVVIRLRGGGSDAFMTEIANGTMDVAVLGLPSAVPPVGVRARVLARERLVAVVPTGHALDGRKRVRLRDLADEAFVDFPAATPGRAQTDLAFRAAGVRRTVSFEATTTELVLDLVAHGLGVTMLADTLVSSNPGLTTVPVTDGPERIEYLAWSAFNPSPATRAFLSGLPHDDDRS